jgi:osomolarity two-component system phosphorelay intermediate protein YPD1
VPAVCPHHGPTTTCTQPRASTVPRAPRLTRHREKKEGKYLKELSELGHFLKGSSATLGLTKVKDSCEKIQHYGQLKDDAGTKDITEEQAQENLAKIIKQAKKEFADVKDILKEFYKDDDDDEA